MSTVSPVTTCTICGLPYFSGVAGYAGQQCKCAFNNQPSGSFRSDLAANCMRLEAELSAMKQRAEAAEAEMLRIAELNAKNVGLLKAAEARIKASQEQETVALSTLEKLLVMGELPKLFTAPVIPPDVAELQRENAELRAANKGEVK